MANNATTMATYLKMAMAGFRNARSSDASYQGTSGRYWSSTPNGDYAYRLFFDSAAIGQDNGQRASGQSVRCFKNSPTIPDTSWTTLYD